MLVQDKIRAPRLRLSEEVECSLTGILCLTLVLKNTVIQLLLSQHIEFLEGVALSWLVPPIIAKEHLLGGKIIWISLFRLITDRDSETRSLLHWFAAGKCGFEKQTILSAWIRKADTYGEGWFATISINGC